MVDATVAIARAPQWLEDWGYTPPAETTVNAFVVMPSRIYATPANCTDKWKALYIMAMAPHTPRRLSCLWRGIAGMSVWWVWGATIRPRANGV